MWTLFIITFAGSEVPLDWEPVEVFTTFELCVEAQDERELEDGQASICSQYMRGIDSDE